MKIIHCEELHNVLQEHGFDYCQESLEIQAYEDIHTILKDSIYENRGESESVRKLIKRREYRADNRFTKIIGRNATPEDLYGYIPTPDAQSVAFAEKYGGTSNDVLLLQSGAPYYIVLFKSIAETLDDLKRGKAENMKIHGWKV